MKLFAVSGNLQRVGSGLCVLVASASVLGLAISAAHAGGEDEERKMPGPRFATFLARMLTYDSQLKKRAGEKLTIAVLYDGKSPASTTQGTDLGTALKNLELVRILDLPVATLGIAVTDASGLEKAVQASGIDAFVVCDGLEKQLGLIRKVSEKRKLITIGTSSAQVRAGLSIAVYLENGKSKILVNLPASRSEGVAFGGELLGLAEVIQ
jgi:hypothetical protein